MTLVKENWVKLDPGVMGQYKEACYDSVDREQFPPVLTKHDFVKRYSKPEGSEFSNASPTWQTVEEFSEYAFPSFGEIVDGVFHLRNRVAGGKTHYNLTPLELVMLWRHNVGDKSQWYASAMAPLHLLNGEIMRTHEGLYLFYSTVRKPMRDSLREGGREAKGIAVQFILKHFMNERSYDWTMMLLDRYPDHVVEFTVVDRCWGTVPGFNTLFWEVRYGY